MNQLAKYEDTTQLTGAFTQAEAVNERLEYAAKNCNLMTPTPVCGTVPLGFEVALSIVQVEQREMAMGGDLYSVGSAGQGAPTKYGLGKATLNRLSIALGVSWDMSLTGRRDDGSDPRYVHYVAVGKVKGLDGAEQTLSGEKEMDMRVGSPQCIAMDARKKGEGDASKQIREMRLHILAHAETKAKLRAIRSMGIKTAYTADDLKKPFVIAKLMFTGRVPGNPALEARFAEMQAAKALGLAPSPSLYAPPAAQALAPASFAPAPAAAPQLPVRHAPPPLNVGQPPAAGAAPPTAVIDAKHTVSNQAPAAAAPAAAPPGDSANASGFQVPGGKEKGKPIEKASDNTLSYWWKRIDANITDGTARNPEADGQLRDAMGAELERRGS